MILRMIRPDHGQVFLFGEKLSPGFDRWNDTGYLVETPDSYPNLTVKENLEIYYKLRRLQNPKLIEDIIQKLKLDRYKDTPSKMLSLGNRQRLGLAKALFHMPKLLLLDEPTNGLDPEGIVEVRELLQGLAEVGTTILISSHILAEVSRMAHRIGIIHEGKLVRELTAVELNHQLNKKLVVHTRDNLQARQLLLNANYTVVLTHNGELALNDPKALAHPEKVSKYLIEHGVDLLQLHVIVEDLERYFLRTIKNRES